MSEDIHNEEEYFKKAYGHFEEDPSPEVWGKINAALDNIDAVNYRNKFVIWKRIACVLLIVLGGLVTYQISITDKNDSISKAEKPGSDGSLEKRLKDSNMIVQKQNGNAQKEPGSLNKNKYNNKDNNETYNSHSTDDNNLTKNLSDKYESQGRKQIPAVNLQTFQQAPLLQDNDPDLMRKNQPVLNERGSLYGKQSENDAVVILPENAEILANKNALNKDANFSIISQNTLDKKQGVTVTTAMAKTKSPGSFKKYWTITPYASVDFTEYVLDDDDSYNNTDPEDKQDIQERESHQFSFSAGILAKWQFLPKLSVKTGLVYSNIAIGIQPQTLYATTENNQSIGYKFIMSSGYAYVNPVFGSAPAVGDSIKTAVAQHHLQYLNLPLLLGYKIIAGKRFSVTPGAGITASILLSTKVRTEINEDTDTEMVVINKLQGLRKTYYSFTADAALEYSINDRLSVTALPVFKYAINSINKNNVVRTYPYSIGLGAGISYRF